MMYVVKKHGAKIFSTNDSNIANHYKHAAGEGAEIVEVLASVECTIDDVEHYAGYYDDTEDWNGFLCPWFTMEEALKMCNSDTINLKYDKLEGVFMDGETLEEFEPHVKQTIDGPKILYPIGAYYWAWDAYEFNR